MKQKVVNVGTSIIGWGAGFHVILHLHVMRGLISSEKAQEERAETSHETSVEMAVVFISFAKCPDATSFFSS